MSEPDLLEDWHWTVQFSTRSVELEALEPQAMWSAIWARMARAHRYISAPEIVREVSDDGGLMTIEARWRSLQRPEGGEEEELLDQSSGCYAAWYKKADRWSDGPAAEGPYEGSSERIDAPW